MAGLAEIRRPPAIPSSLSFTAQFKEEVLIKFLSQTSHLSLLSRVTAM